MWLNISAPTAMYRSRIMETLGLLLLAAVTVSALPDETGIHERSYPGQRAEREKRQVDRNQIINDIFQIPIQTLTAVQNLVQNTRPLFPNRYSAAATSGSSSGGSSSGGSGSQGSTSGYQGGLGGLSGFLLSTPQGASGAAASASRPRPPRPSFAVASSLPIFDFFGRPRPSRGPLSFGANAVQVPIQTLSAVGHLLQDLSSPVRHRFKRSVQ